MTRPIEEWADLKYTPTMTFAHVVPFSEQGAICGLIWDPWLGTGTFDEIEEAQNLPLCVTCADRVYAMPAIDPDPGTDWGDDIDLVGLLTEDIS
jgi:hypothetical protein